MKVYKKVNKHGGITLPQMIRHELNIPAGAAIELETLDEEIIIRKHIPTCLICGTSDQVVVDGEVEICKECLEKLRKEEPYGIKRTESQG